MFNEVYLMMHLALIPVFITEFHLTLFQVSFIASVPTAVGILMNVAVGYLVDKIGAKPLLVIGLIIQAVGGLIVSQSSTFELLILGLTCIGISNPLYHNPGLSTISKSLSEHDLMRGAGIHAASGSVGISMGLFGLSLFLIYNQWRLAYLIWIVPFLVWAILLLRVKMVTPPQHKKQIFDEIDNKGRLLKKAFIFFLIALGLSQAGTTAIQTFMTTYMVLGRGIPKATASLIFTLGPLISITGALFSGYFGGRLGDFKMLMLMIGITSVSSILLPLTPTDLLLTVVFASFTFFSCTVWPPINSMTASLSPINKRGLAYSLSQTTFQAMSALSPPITAMIIESTSLIMMFPFSFLLLLASMLALRKTRIK
jgi:MFS family permease